MAVPKFTPVPAAVHVRSYESPDFVPDRWLPDRPGEIEGFQPVGRGLGDPGPDQGFTLRIASALQPKLILADDESVDDAIRGCIGIANRRASMFSRAPVVHDLDIAFTIWGFYDADPPVELVELRRTMFEGLRHTNHHYTEARAVADLPPESTLRMTPAQVAAAYPAQWRTLLGV